MDYVVLIDVCEKIGSGATPRGGSDVYLSKGEIALIRSQNIYNDGFKKNGLAFITDIHAKELENVKVESGDILLNITGDSVARCCQVPDKFIPARVNQHVAIIRPHKDFLDARYLRYYLISPLMQDHMLTLASGGATRNALTKGMIESFEIPAPPLPKQRAIAGILGSLDDKIELNQRMNVTLESMARAVFREWFVDGEDVGEIKDLGEVVTGKTPPTSNRENYGGEIPFITIPDMHGKMFVLATGKTLSMQGSQTQRNKTLPPFSICISCIGTLGLVSITTEIAQTNQQINSLIPKDSKSVFYCYFALRELGDEIRARGSGGSVLLNLNKGQFETMPISIHQTDLMHKFQDFSEPLMMRILANNQETQTLASLRDSLLPRLMSGEVRVKGVLE